MFLCLRLCFYVLVWRKSRYEAVAAGADNVRLMVLVCVARRATATYWNICEASEELVAWDLADWSLPMVRAVAWQTADANLFLVLS